ncbi:DUF2971 domain-containing protein, partial [Streptococcus sanguinis]|uniref:DUF2971 domain-containing protein n=1 Tax=Streptococcus sanguinis TaxID=1305 RepID=UPI000B170D7C
PDSKDIALCYAKVLFNLSNKQTELSEVEVTVEKLKSLQERYPDSKDIALCYAKILFNLSKQQTKLEELAEIVKRIFEILKSFSNIEIFRIVVEILENNSNIPLDTNNISTTSITKILDKLCFNAADNIGRELLIRALAINLAIKTKYDILKGWIEHYKDNQKKLNQLIDIYRVVQEIKYQLGLKPKDEHLNIKFGHYTSGKVLQILLEQPEEDDISVYGKTRLSNANYMNDPEEGIILEKIFNFKDRDIMEPSSWFLMSFTSKTDDLAMWSQYGDDAQGVCIVLREDDFSRFTSVNDVSWRQEKTSLEFSDKMSLVKSELNSGFEKSIFRSESENSVDTVNDEGTEPNSVEKDSDSKGNVDYLYRIAYVNDSGGKFSIEKTELFKDDEIINLELLLKALKDKIDEDLDKGDDFYQKAISDCIEEIRYLFKSVDYKYEDELRILRYANLEPSNEEIKIDKSSGIGKLYVERENPVQIAEVVFGPKFANPEYVTPLLKLLDKDIAFKKSTIKFR